MGLEGVEERGELGLEGMGRGVVAMEKDGVAWGGRGMGGRGRAADVDCGVWRDCGLLLRYMMGRGGRRMGDGGSGEEDRGWWGGVGWSCGKSRGVRWGKVYSYSGGV